MSIRISAILSIIALTGCTTESTLTCDEGFTAVDGACVAADAGVDMTTDSDTSVDTGTDAPDLGPCGELCNGATPVCNTDTNTCTQCQASADCAALTERPLCNDAGSCVQCIDDSDCSDPTAPVCGDDGLCAPCTVGENAGCAGVENGDGDALAICADVDGSPTCVQCTNDDESACGDNVCDVRNRTCTDTPAAMTGPCRECVSSSQCMTGQVCARDPRGGDDAPFVCLWDEDADVMGVPAGACINAAPFTTGRETTLIDGTMMRVCSRAFASCAAADDHRTGGRGGAECGDDDTLCGAIGVDDAFCREDTDSGAMRCTIACSSDDDCILGPLNMRFPCDTVGGTCLFSI